MRAVLGLAVVLAAAGCGAPGTAADQRPAREPSVTIVDVDAYGAIVIDAADRTARGIRRDGTEEWRIALDAQVAAPVGCLRRCPDAVLSGSAASAAAAAVPDPDPVLVVGGERRPLSAPAAVVKRRVLTATGLDDLVLALGDAQRAWLEVRTAGGMVRTVPVGGPRTSWEESADGRWALALTVREDGSSEARWFTRQDGWTPFGTSTPVEAVAACVDPDGGHALLLGQRPALLDHTGGQRDVSDLDRAGTCGRAQTGGILADLAFTAGGGRSRLRVLAPDGAVTARHELPDIASVAADPTGPRVAYVALGVLHEADTRSGAELRTIEGTRAARYDGAGGILVVRGDRTVAWLSG